MNTYVSAGPPAWTYIIAIPIVIMIAVAWFSSFQPGRKVKRYKIVNGRRVRDYTAERDLTRRTRR
jgi:hypothetical protein